MGTNGKVLSLEKIIRYVKERFSAIGSECTMIDEVEEGMAESFVEVSAPLGMFDENHRAFEWNVSGMIFRDVEELLILGDTDSDDKQLALMDGVKKMWGVDTVIGLAFTLCITGIQVSEYQKDDAPWISYNFSIFIKIPTN